METQRKVASLAQEKYKGINHTHLTELLAEREGVELSRPTVRRILAKIRITDEVERVENERISVERRMRRLGQVYLDNLSITRSTVVRSEFWRTGCRA